MFRNYALKSAVWHKPDIEFEWDPETRSVRGRDANMVIDVALVAKRQGDVVSHPYPTVYETRDPLRNPGEMAAVLGQYWQLTPDLSSELPVYEDDGESEPIVIERDGKKIVIGVLN